MVKYIQINDVHSSDRPPRFRTNSYQDDIFHKLEWIWCEAEKMEIDFLLFTGDVFHFPQATKVSHALVNRWMSLLDKAPAPIYIVPGNHDIAAGRLESLPKQPLGTLATHKLVTLLHDGVPHQVAGISIAGVGWNYAISAEYIKSIVTTVVDVLALHAPILTKPNPFFDTIQPEQLEGLAGIICYGHIHDQHPLYQVNGTYFSNPGGLARRCLGGHLENDAERKPAIMYYYDGVFEYIEVPHRPATDVYRIDAHDAKAEDDEAIAAFVASLGETNLTAVTVEALAQEAQAMTDNPRVRAILQDIFDEVS